MDADSEAVHPAVNLIIAETFRQARLVAEALGLTPREWKFVHEPYRLNGWDRDTRVFIYETAYRRRDYEYMCDFILPRFENVQPIDEWFIGGPTAAERRSATGRW